MTSTRFGFGDFQYEVVPEWGLSREIGVVSDVVTDSEDRVYVAVRNTPHPEVLGGAIFDFARQGQVID